MKLCHFDSSSLLFIDLCVRKCRVLNYTLKKILLKDEIIRCVFCQNNIILVEQLLLPVQPNSRFYDDTVSLQTKPV